MNTGNFPFNLGASAPTPPESPQNFVNLPLDLTASPSPTTKRNRTSDPIDKTSDEYRRKRDKNNIAAKKSRDARRAREDQTALKVKHLEKVALMYETEIKMLRNEIMRLQGIPKQ